MLNYPEAVTAASLALPIVEREIAKLNRQMPSGDNEVADARREAIRAILTPLYQRRRQLLTVITDISDYS